MLLLLVLQSLIVFGFVTGLFLEQMTVRYFVMFGMAAVVLLWLIWRVRHPVSREAQKEKEVRRREREQSRVARERCKKEKAHRKAHEFDWIDEMEFLDAIFDDNT